MALDKSSNVWQEIIAAADITSSLCFSSHPDVLQFVHRAVLRGNHVCPLLLAPNCPALKVNDHLKEHHLLWQLTEAVVETQPVVSIRCDFHTVGGKILSWKYWNWCFFFFFYHNPVWQNRWVVCQGELVNWKKKNTKGWSITSNRSI